MISVVDTTVIVDFLRGHEPARQVLRAARVGGVLASEMTRLEILAGTRPNEKTATLSLLESLAWRPVDTDVAEEAGRLGRQWLPSHSGIDGADLAIAATVILTAGTLLTRNVRHFPMFPDLTAPY